ncbi:MAG: DciA family protein [Hyphomicrobium sp.]
MRGPAWLPVKAVGTFVPKLTQKSFEKYGFSTATLLTDWVRIVGQDLAQDTAPERLKWPRGMAEQRQKSGDDKGLGGATLVLRVDPARALDISYKERQITERINTYFGYRAVCELRIIQAPVVTRSDQPESPFRRTAEESYETVTPNSPDEHLLLALARLEARVLGKV